MVVTLFTISLILGKTRVPETVGENGRKIGASPTGAFQFPEAPKSYSSQENVIASPLASVPLAVKEKGVK